MKNTSFAKAIITLIFCFTFAKMHNCCASKPYNVTSADIMHDEDDSLIDVIGMEDEDDNNKNINPVTAAFVLGAFLNQQNDVSLLFHRLKSFGNKTTEYVSAMLQPTLSRLQIAKKHFTIPPLTV